MDPGDVPDMITKRVLIGDQFYVLSDENEMAP